MSSRPVCDFCGRPGSGDRHGHDHLELDEDDLWVCAECRGRLRIGPVGPLDDGVELVEAIVGLVGQSAGAICRTLNLPYEPPFDSIIDAASRIAYDEDRYMSAWTFVTQWLDGTSVWLSPDRSAKALAPPEGDIQIISTERGRG